MIKVLTETEYKFLKEFIALIEKYNLLFTTDEKGEIEVTVHRQQLATETNQNSDLLHTPIHLGDCFDETELNYILDQTDERIKQMYRNMIQYLTENSFLVFCTFTGASIAIYLLQRRTDCKVHLFRSTT